MIVGQARVRVWLLLNIVGFLLECDLFLLFFIKLLKVAPLKIKSESELSILKHIDV